MAKRTLMAKKQDVTSLLPEVEIIPIKRSSTLATTVDGYINHTRRYGDYDKDLYKSSHDLYTIEVGSTSSILSYAAVSLIVLLN